MAAAGFSFFQRIRLLLGFILIAVLVEATLSALAPLGVYFFVDRVAPAPSRNALYLLLGVVAGAAVLGLLGGLLRDNLDGARPKPRAGRAPPGYV